jgi:peptidoglycan/LPS O-acetylase OafA/YrhL/glycosyltransferase involved in cell wall biosynthesis
MNSFSTLTGLQLMRALACLAVVVYHAAEMWRTRLSPGGTVVWPLGAAGVDVFFVISGFVMVLSASRRANWRAFLRARLRRIVPLYWLCSLAKMGGLFAAGDTARLGLSYCLRSLLFLPVHDAAGLLKPVLPVGWTLSFEMLFYGLCAVALGAGMAPAVFVPPVLLALSLVPHGGSALGELASPIVLEFVYGMALAVLWRRGWLGAVWHGPVLLAASIACLVLMPQVLPGVRFLDWGVPAALAVGGMVCLEPILAPHIPRFLRALGDASYAIYLTHGFVLAGLAMVLQGTPLGRSAPATAICAVVASAGFGWLVHNGVERRWLGRREQPAAAARVLVLVGGGFAPLSGGVGVLLRNLIDVWATMPQSPQLRMLDTRGGGGKVSGALWFAVAVLRVAWLCATGRAQLVHAHMTTRGSALRKTLLCSLAMCLRVPVVMHMHGADFMPYYRRLPRWLQAPLAAVLRHASHVVVLGTAWRDFLIDEVGVRPRRVSILANGVPLPPGGPPIAPPNRPLLLFLGRLCARKGVPELIAALGTPTLRDRAWQAVIAGDGDPAPYRAMLTWHRLEPRVEMPGWLGRDAVLPMLQRADILILPSHHEAQPIAVLEALAAGVAVIASPVGTLPEFLQHEVTALLVPPGDIAALARAIERLLDDTALRARLAAAGHRVFREKLEIGGVASRLAAVYRTAIEAPAWQAAEAAE